MTGPKKVRGLRAAAAFRRLGEIYDRIYSKRRMRSFEKAVIGLSIAGFLVHLALIFIAGSFVPRLSAVAGRNYLAAIYTPFSIVLFYEVLVLISAIPQSATESVATQFEIVSLIFIRGFFHEIGVLDLHKVQVPTIDVLWRLLDDIGGALILFALIAVFKRVARRPDAEDPAERLIDPETLLLWKKIIALAVTVVLVAATASGFQAVLRDAYRLAVQAPGAATHGPELFFYNDVFMAMIFTDVLILILSLVLSGQYDSVYRNAAFVVARTLMRFSLLAEQPNQVIFATVGIVFAILTMIVYNYGRKRDSAFGFEAHHASSEGEMRRWLR